MAVNPSGKRQAEGWSPREEAQIDGLSRTPPHPQPSVLGFLGGGSGERIQLFWWVTLGPQTQSVVTDGAAKREEPWLRSEDGPWLKSPNYRFLCDLG